MKKDEWTWRCRVKGRLNTTVHLSICGNNSMEREKVKKKK